MKLLKQRLDSLPFIIRRLLSSFYFIFSPYMHSFNHYTSVHIKRMHIDAKLCFLEHFEREKNDATEKRYMGDNRFISQITSIIGIFCELNRLFKVLLKSQFCINMHNSYMY